MYSISVIIPMYNEERNAPIIVDHVASFLSPQPFDWEINVVESGSTDRTLEVVQALAQGNPKIRVFHQERRDGMGSALRLGYSRCRYDLIWHVESDSPFDASHVLRALPLLETSDFVAGYRIGKRESFLRWLYSFVYNRLVRVLFGLHVRDVNFSFKVFKRRNLEKITLRSQGWFIDAELLIETKKQGFTISELGVPYTHRFAGTSTVSLLTPFPIIREMLAYRMKHFRSM